MSSYAIEKQIQRFSSNNYQFLHFHRLKEAHAKEIEVPLLPFLNVLHLSSVMVLYKLLSRRHFFHRQAGTLHLFFCLLFLLPILHLRSVEEEKTSTQTQSMQPPTRKPTESTPPTPTKLLNRKL